MTHLNPFVYCLMAFCISLLVSFFLLKGTLALCRTHKWYDTPDARKIHQSGIPRLGGIIFMPALLCGVIITIAIKNYIETAQINLFHPAVIIMGGGMLCVYIIGIFDDLLDCNAKLKFAIQFLAALCLVGCGLYIDSLYGFLGIDELPLWIAYPLSVFLCLLITNAYNLIDGIDGLSSSLSLVALLIYTYYLSSMGLLVLCLAALSLIASLLVFLPFNIWGSTKKGTKTFMGDSGSLFLGIILSYFTLKIGQRNGIISLNNENGLLIVYSTIIVPCFDLCRVALCRLRRGQGIFSPDRTHIHHKFMAKGFSMHTTTALIVALQCLYFSLNICLWHIDVQLEFILCLDIILFTLLNIWLPNPKNRIKGNTPL